MSATQNLEEAANVASEFIYGIDNLPNEVNFILQELKHKDARTQELQQEIDKDTAKYIRHSLKTSSSSPSIPSSPSSRTPSPKLIALPAKIQASYAEIHLLSTEKCALAQTLIDLITRTRAKLDTDLAKVRVLQGDLDYSATLASSTSFVGTDSFTALGRSAVQQVTESMRNALAAPALADIKNATAMSSAASPAGSATGGPAYKKRRVATGSIKLTPAGSPAKHRSASPTTAPSATHTRVASRLSRQSTKQEETEVDEGDEDAEGEEGDAEDERLYCTCQSQSYGDMIACDNEGCPYEWFHVSCVNLKGPAPDKWYCNFCIKKLGGVPSMTGRKGRKK